MLRDVISEKVHSSTTEQYSYYIWFRPEKPLTGTMEKMDILFEELNALGKCLTFPDESDLPLLDEMDPENCYFSWEIIISTDKKEEFIRELFKDLASGDNLSIIKVCDCNVLGDVLLKKGIIEFNKMHGRIGAEKIMEMITGKKSVSGHGQEKSQIPVSDMTVHTIEETRAKIDELIAAGKKIELVATGVSAIDISFLQLIYSLRQGNQREISFRWQEELPADIQSLLVNTGFADLVKESTNPEKE